LNDITGLSHEFRVCTRAMCVSVL